MIKLRSFNMNCKGPSLVFIGLFFLMTSVTATAEPIGTTVDASPVFFESFENRTLVDGRILDNQGTAIWKSDRVDVTDKTYDFSNRLSASGSLLLGGSEEKQQLTLLDADKIPLNYGASFEFKVQSMANAGMIVRPSRERPIIAVIPRTSDSTFKDYYAIIYYLENSEVSKLVANMFKCKWELVRINQGTTMTILDQGYFMVDEHLTYRGEWFIQNDKHGNVDIAFYIDSPTMPNGAMKPLLSCKDKSAQNIKGGKSAVAFQVGGFDPAGFQFTPIVELMNFEAYNLKDFNKWLGQEQKFYTTSLSYTSDMKAPALKAHLNYLKNRGVIDESLLKRINANGYVSESDFLVMLLKTLHYQFPQTGANWDKLYLEKAMSLNLIDKLPAGSKPITDFEAANILYRLSEDKTIDRSYTKVLKFKTPTVLENAVHYAYQNNLIAFDTKKPIGPSKINLSDTCQIIMRFIGASTNLFNYPLEMPYVLGNGAILQRNKPIPIWGRGVSGDTVTVKFNQNTLSTVVENGYWRVVFPAQKEGGPYTIQINDAKMQIVLKDVYVGEVFLISGQSNAEWYLKDSDASEQTVQNLSDQIKNRELIYRYFKPQQVLALTQNFSSKGFWYNMNAHLLNNSSAIGNFYVEKLIALNPELKKVPIGLVNVAYGGSTIELFMPTTEVVNPYGMREHSDPVLRGFWNGYMAGVSQYPFKAAIYYQGENSVQLRYDYERMLSSFIQGFRLQAGDLKLPFILIQLTGYGESYYDEDTWPIIREIQQQVAQTMTGVEVVTAIDLSDENNWEIHPKSKKPIGERLAYKAMEKLYGKNLGHRSPEMGYFSIKGNSVLISFDYVEGSLKFNEKGVSCFEVLGQDGKWYPATGEVVNNSWLKITSPQVEQIKAARYAYRNYPIVALYDDFMPVLPFNTDRPPVNPQKKVIDNFHLYMPYHGLNDWDAVVNVTRGNVFRTIERIDAFNVQLTFGIKKQAVGDQIILLHRDGSAKLEKGSTETLVKISNHHLKAGDWIRNTSRKYADSMVIAVIDRNTVQVNKIEAQAPGDLIELYHLRTSLKVQ